MKITKRKIVASTVSSRIPVPFDRYYRIASDAEVNDFTGYYPEPGEKSPCEEAQGYNIKHIAWAMAKDEYLDALANNAIDIVELVTSDWDNSTPMLAYVVKDRIYPLDIDEVEDCISSSGIINITTSFDVDGELTSDEAFGDDWVAGIAARFSVSDDVARLIFDLYDYMTVTHDFDTISSFLDYLEDNLEDDVVGRLIPLMTEDERTIIMRAMGWDSDSSISGSANITAATWMGKYTTVDGKVKKVYFDCDGCDFEDAEKYFEDIIPEAYTNAKLLGTAPAVSLLEKDGFVPIDSCNDIRGSVDTGLEYWYYTKHGLGPGMMPNDVQVVDWYEDDHWNTWFKTDKLLTTQELNEYDIKEECPPEGVTTHSGDIISCNITSSECSKVSETDTSINYVVSSEESKPDWIVDSPIKDDPIYEQKRIDRELADEADAYDLEHGEGQYQDIEGRSLINYCDYRIMSSPETGGWDVLEKDYSVVKTGFPTERDAKDYIDELCASTNVDGVQIEAAIDIDSIDVGALKNELNEGCLAYLTECGFCKPGEKEDKWDISADEVYVLEVEREDDKLRCEVRAELSYEGMEDLAEELDPIVQEYDEDAYFEQVEPGIMQAYIFSSAVNASTEIKGSFIDIDTARERYYLNPDYDPNPYGVYTQEDDEWYKESMQDEDILIEFNGNVSIDDDGVWTFEDESFLEPLRAKYGRIYFGIFVEDFYNLLIKDAPYNEGKYLAKGRVILTYSVDVDDGIINYTYIPEESKILNLDIQPREEIENSTKIEAGLMTEEDLDYAILNNKPFDIDSFRKYKMPGPDPDALRADQIEVGDVIEVTESAEEVNLGTRVRILAINDPGENWIDYTFHVELLDKPGRKISDDTVLRAGDEIDLHFDADEYVGTLVLDLNK